MENLDQKMRVEIGNIVIYDGESCLVVDIEDIYIWIRNVMDPRITQKVKKNEIAPEGGYGKTTADSQERPSIILESTDGLSQNELIELKRLTAQITKNTRGKIKNLRFPST